MAQKALHLMSGPGYVQIYDDIAKIEDDVFKC